MLKGLLARGVLVCLVLVAAALFTGCQAPNSWEKAGYETLMAQGAPPIEEYSPVAAGLLNILPGIGDAYLGEWGAFVCNFLLWPYSVVWGIPEAILTANNKNVTATYYYYYMGPARGRYNVDPSGGGGRSGPAPGPAGPYQ